MGAISFLFSFFPFPSCWLQLIGESFDFVCRWWHGPTVLPSSLQTKRTPQVADRKIKRIYDVYQTFTGLIKFDAYVQGTSSTCHGFFFFFG